MYAPNPITEAKAALNESYVDKVLQNKLSRKQLLRIRQRFNGSVDFTLNWVAGKVIDILLLKQLPIKEQHRFWLHIFDLMSKDFYGLKHERLEKATNWVKLNYPAMLPEFKKIVK
jgi:hypothetical protein